jgi:hypothetical protein
MWGWPSTPMPKTKKKPKAVSAGVLPSGSRKGRPNRGEAAMLCATCRKPPPADIA